MATAETAGQKAGSAYRYAEMTWPEIGAAAAADRVVVVPIGTVEDHGRHLPVDTDVRIIDAISSRACQAEAETSVLLPPVWHGYSPHHMDFPGPITIRYDVFVEYLLGITRSLIAHGFKRIILANGHGSNMPLVNMAARLTIIEHADVICCDYFYLVTPQGLAAIDSIREAEFPGGMGHACELETSIYLALRPDLVQMDKAVRDLNQPPSDYFYQDWVSGPGSMMEWWSTLTRDGVMGDATLATREKGEKLLAAAVDELRMVIAEMKTRTIRPRVDHH
jgi:creatinine amidohydrolase